MDEERTGAGDPSLAPFLAARDEEEARERLGDLLTGVAAPLVGKVLRRQLADAAPEDLEDLQAGALLRIQLQLQALRSGEREPMASFPDYVAVVAFNAVSAHLMAREPERLLDAAITLLLAALLASWAWRVAQPLLVPLAVVVVVVLTALVVIRHHRYW